VTVHLPTWTQLLALLGCLVVGAVAGWLLLAITTSLDFTLDCWWSYDVAPRLIVPLLLVGAAIGVWFWVAVIL
jgi:hypothetical protein